MTVSTDDIIETRANTQQVRANLIRLSDMIKENDNALENSFSTDHPDVTDDITEAKRIVNAGTAGLNATAEIIERVALSLEAITNVYNKWVVTLVGTKE